MSEKRGTLTFTQKGEIILSLPEGLSISPAMGDELSKRLEEWLRDDERRAIVVSFPIDVIDQRL